MGQETLAHGGSGGGTRPEAERLLAIAEKLLVARDLVGSKKFAEWAMDSDPLLDGVDQILAVADVLLASQRRMNNHVDWYSVLQIEPFSDDISTVKLHYRRLALLLHPDKNRSSGADQAFKIVVEAWSILSDPSKKAIFDRELIIASSHFKSNGHDDAEKQKIRRSNDGFAAFWTACLHCCHVYQYVREYEGRSLRCQNCRKAFHATEMSSPPPVVAGTDMYYCSWGLHPLGFPGGPVFPGVPGPGGREPLSSSPLRRDGESRYEIGSGNKKQSFGTDSANPNSKKKKLAVKPAKRQTAASVRKEGTAVRSGVDINVEPRNEATVEMKQADVGCSENAGVMGDTLDMNRFIIELDGSDEVLGNLSNLPFLKAEEHFARPSLFDG